MGHRCAMTGRDVVKLRIFTTQTTLRENTQPYRSWGLKIFTPLALRFQDFQRMISFKCAHYLKDVLRCAVFSLSDISLPTTIIHANS
jgi:hypothetical protein